MANYTSSHTGEKIDEAVTKALGSKSVTSEEVNTWNGKAEGNHNHNSNYAPLSHSNDGNIHVTSAQKTDWNSKATGSHNHNSNYAPIAHSNDGNIHVSASQKNDWNGKAAGGHGHTLASLGAAPAGYGVGEILWNNAIHDPLSGSLLSGRYGLVYSMNNPVNLPEANFIGYVDIAKCDNSWQYVTAYDIHKHKHYVNRYFAEEGKWTGWHYIFKPEMATMSCNAMWLGSGTHQINLDSSYAVLIVGTGITTHMAAATNKTVVCTPRTNADQWHYIASTSTGNVRVDFKGTYFIVEAAVSELFYLSYACLDRAF